MSDLRTAAQRALEYLYAPSAKLWPAGTQHRIITALKAALAEPVQEPVAWMHVPYPGNGMSPMLSLSKHREPSIYAASVPLFLKEQL